MNVSTFTNDHLKNMLNAIHHENKSTLLAGDFNLNLINYNKAHTILLSYSLTTFLHRKLHTLHKLHTLPQFIFLENLKGNNLKRERTNTTYRDFRYFDIGSFKRDLQEINWNFATENNDIDLGFETFFRLFNKTLDIDMHQLKPQQGKKEKLSLNSGLQKA